MRAAGLILDYLGDSTRHYLATWNQGQPARFEDTLSQTRFGGSRTVYAPEWLPRKQAATRILPLTCIFSVELRGFEPLTPSMRTRCATGLRYSP